MAYCEYEVDNAALSLQEALTYCGVGWHVCSAAEFTARNDSILTSYGFTARIDDGANCYAVNDAIPGVHEASEDTVRSVAPGSCQGSTAAATWGRQELPACVDFANNCGVLCCTDELPPPSYSWQLVGQETATVVLGACSSTKSEAAAVCDASTVGEAVFITASDSYLGK